MQINPMLFTSLQSIRKNMQRVATVAFVVAAVFAQSGIVSAATYTFTQTNWSGGVTANNAVHDVANNQSQQGWQQYASSTTNLATINSGADLQVSATASSTTQTDEGSSNTGFSLTGNAQSQTSINGVGSDASVQLATTGGAFGSGADGSVTISSVKNINTNTIAAGRTCADGISYNVTSLTANTATLSGNPPAGCFAVGDQIILINEQGDGVSTPNTGNYEFLTIQSISEDVITFTDNKIKYYGTGASDDTDLASESWESDIALAGSISALNVGAYSTPTFSDLDNDGDNDLVVGELDGVLNWYRNTGSVTVPAWTLDATLAGSISTLDIGSNSAPTFVDLDNDGDNDLVVGELNGGTLNWYRNTGSVTVPAWTLDATLANSISMLTVGAYSTPTFADLDNDGDNDLVVGELDGVLNWYRNTGSVTVPAWTLDATLAGSISELNVGNYSAPMFADLDSDGDNDFIIGEHTGVLNWYRNTGSVTVPAWTLDATLARDISALVIGLRSTPTFADLDNDGDDDFVIGEKDGVLNWYRNVLGPATYTQKVVLQRVPQYEDVTITGTGSLTANSWNGLKGGLLVFYASGNVTVQTGGSITMTGSGYRGGDYGCSPGVRQGESYRGCGIYSNSRNLGGGGGGNGSGGNVYDFGGGGYGTVGSPTGSEGGNTYGTSTLATLYLGSGGGSSGGGIVYVRANAISLTGSILNTGGDYGGSGGSVYVEGNTIDTGINKVVAIGGIAGEVDEEEGCNCWWVYGSGGNGRIFVKSSSISGSTSPTAVTAPLLTEYLSNGTYTSGVMNLGGIGGYSTFSYTASTTAQATMTLDVRAGNSSTPDGTWTAWQSGISNGGSIANLGTNRYFQYRANLATTNNTQTPSLRDVTVAYTIYATNQSLVSSKYDTNSAENVMGSIAWDEDASLPTGTTVTVSLRTAATAGALDSATWYAFTNASVDCVKTDTSVLCPSSALATAGSVIADGVNDQWYQYKVLVTSTGVSTPTIPEVRVQYVVNAPPELTGVSATQITTASDVDWGKIVINYSVRDIDADTGSITPGYVTPSFEYNIGGGWVVIDEAYLAVSAMENKIATQIGYVSYSTAWDAKAQIPGNYTVNTQVRVTVNDNEPANNIGQATTAGFALDTKAPVILGTINGTTNEIGFAAADDQNVSYKLSNNNDGTYDSVNQNSGQWIAAGMPTIIVASTTWNLIGAPSNQIVYLFAMDDYGNTASSSVVGPASPTYFDLKDASNVLIENYQLFLSWKVYTTTTSATFSRYEMYRSTDGFTFALQDTITNPAINYYADTNLASSTTYYYKLLVVDGDDDVSAYSTTLSHIPSGQGGTDSTRPTISAVTVAERQSTYAKITFTTNELAFGTVEYAAVGGAPYSIVVTKDTIALDHVIVLTNLDPNTDYVFRVKATDIADNEATRDNSGAGYAFTTQGGPTISDVTATLADDRNATIVWNTNEDTDSGLVYANSIAAFTTGMGTTAVQDVAFVGGEGPLYQHKIALTDLSPRTTYYYYVESTDSDGNTGVDKNGLNYYTFTTSYDRRAPIVTGITTPVITETAVVVLWKTDELADTQVSYGTTSGVYTEQTDLDTNMSIVHAATVSGLTTNTTYYYVVKSTDPGGNATTSAEQTVTTAKAQEVKIVTIGGGAGKTDNPPPDVKDTAAAAITNITVASTTAFSTVLSFETNEPTVIGLRYGRTTAYDRAEASIDWKRAHEVRLAGLRLGTEYHYQIKAIDKGGNESFSDDSVFTTKFVADASENVRSIENLQQYEQEIEDSIESILPSIFPPFVEEAQVTNITESTATINWRTNINTYATIAYAPEEVFTSATTTRTEYTAEVSDITNKTREHSLTLIGLRPNTTYHFKTKSFSVPQVIGEGRDTLFTTKAPAVQASVIDVKTTSFRATWTTDTPASSIVEYKNLATGVIERIINEPLTMYHDMLVENLRPGNRYEVTVFGYSAQGNLLSSGTPINVLTSTDVSAPKISNFKVDGALVPGRTDRIQTIVSWTTDEPATGIVEYQEGSGAVEGGFANKVTITDSFVTNHVVILTNLKPGVIYQFKVTSADQPGNMGSFGPRTIITPQKGESIFDVIFKNFEDTFKFLRGAGQ